MAAKASFFPYAAAAPAEAQPPLKNEAAALRKTASAIRPSRLQALRSASARTRGRLARRGGALGLARVAPRERAAARARVHATRVGAAPRSPRNAWTCRRGSCAALRPSSERCLQPRLAPRRRRPGRSAFAAEPFGLWWRGETACSCRRGQSEAGRGSGRRTVPALCEGASCRPKQRARKTVRHVRYWLFAASGH